MIDGVRFYLSQFRYTFQAMFGSRCPFCWDTWNEHVRAVFSPDGFCGNSLVYGEKDARTRMLAQQASRDCLGERRGLTIQEPEVNNV